MNSKHTYEQTWILIIISSIFVLISSGICTQKMLYLEVNITCLYLCSELSCTLQSYEECATKVQLHSMCYYRTLTRYSQHLVVKHYV